MAAPPPLLPTLRGYRRSWLRYDVLAGLAAGSVVVPQAMSYATIAGLPVEYGLYTCMLPMLVYAALGGSHCLSMSTTSTIAVLVAVSVVPAGGITPTGEDLLTRVFTLSFLVGLLLLLARALRLAGLVENISPATLTGVKVGVGLTVAATQLPALLGVPDRADHTGFGPEIRAVVDQLDAVSGVTLAVSAGAVAVLLALRFLAPLVPGPLVVVAGGIALVALTDVRDRGLAVVDEVQSGLPALSVPDPGLITGLLPGALAIAVMAFLETAAVARGIRRRDEPRIDSDQELLAVGVASLAGGLTQTLPPAGGFSQSAVSQRAGARSQLSGIVTVALAVAVALFLAPLVADLPRAILAAMVLVAVLGLIDVREFGRLWRINATEFWVAIATALAGLVLGLLAAVGLGVVVTLLLVLKAIDRPRIDVVAPTRPEAPLVVRLDISLYAANARATAVAIEEAAVSSGAPAVVLDADGVRVLTTIFLDTLRDLDQSLAPHGIVLVVGGMREEPRRRALRSAWFREWAAAGHLAGTVDEGVAAAATLTTAGRGSSR